MTHMSWSVLKRNPPLRACYYFSRCQLDPKTLIEQLTRCYTPQRVPAVVSTAVTTLTCGANCLLLFFHTFFFSYQKDKSVVTSFTAQMGDSLNMGRKENIIDVTSGPSFRTAASVVRTYNNTPPQFANVWLLFLYGLFIFLNLSRDYYIPILSYTFPTTFIQTRMGNEETPGASTLCRGAPAVIPGLDGTSVVSIIIYSDEGGGFLLFIYILSTVKC